jgi:hypothetical protein
MSKMISGNEYGLDSYLSTRIRHGVLSGQLRSPFTADDLITQRTPQGEYARNERWEDWIAENFGNSLAGQVEQRLREFSRDADRVIDAFRSERMQVKTQADDRGLFDYVYSIEEHGQQVWHASVEAENYIEYMRAMFKIVYDRTAQNLQQIARYVRGELADDFHKLLRVLTRDLHELSPTLTHGSLGNAIRQCGLALQNNLEATASWFAPNAERGAITVDLEVLGLAVIDTVSKMYPAYELRIVNNTTSGLLVEGYLLLSLWDVVLILLDNCVRHSGMTLVRGHLRFARSGDYISLEVRNEVANGIGALEKVASSLSIPSTEWKASSAVRSEGGSGYYKLHKILRYDLRADLDYSILATVESHEGWNEFVVNIEYRNPES